MGFPPLLNLSTRLSTAALPGQPTKTALTEEFMFQNVAYRPTVYRTGQPYQLGDLEHVVVCLLSHLLFYHIKELDILKGRIMKKP